MILEIFMLSLFTWGVAALFDEGMILGRLGSYLESKIPVYFLKPFFACPACMSSVYGIAWATYYNYPFENYIILILCTCGLNFIIMKFLMR